MRILVLTFLFGFLGTFTVSSQVKKYKQGMKIPHQVCYASGKVEKSYTPPPDEFLTKSAKKTSDIVVEYIGFTEEAQIAFEYAVNIWETIVESDMPIRMQARWSSNLGTNVLGSCGPETYYANFKDAPFKDVYYPVAIAEKIAKQELNGITRADLEANFSSKADWYLGTDGNTPDDKYDLVTVVLHEIGHGLGFTGFFFVDDNQGGYGYRSINDRTSFDLLVEQFTGRQLVDSEYFNNPSAELRTAFQSGSLYANSPVAMTVNDDSRPRLYAPFTYDEGSSIYHLNDATFPAGNPNALMTHAIGQGEAIHDPGPITRGIMEDIGWSNLILHFSPLKDSEAIRPLTFNLSVDNKYDLDTTSLVVIYSDDNFETTPDTLQLLPGDNDTFSATFTPEAETDSIVYYLKAEDVKGRVKTMPCSAPDVKFAVRFGPDSEAPAITHSPIAYYLLHGEDLMISAVVNDNLGVDTVMVSFTVNGEAQPAFGLSNQGDNIFSGPFRFGELTLNDGDVISYSIQAKDEASTPNVTTYPADGSLSFKIEQIFDPVTKYYNDLNSETADFIISDFSIYTADGFPNHALHSPHPYTSPEKDNFEFEFSTFLKRPIIVRDEGKIIFDEIVLVEPGEASAVYGDEDFWDYVILEGSKDFGDNWWPIADGYDSGDNATWKQQYNANIVGNNSQTVGNPEWFETREVSLTESGRFAEGDTVLIRFRLHSDPYANGWGWAIDNLRIQIPVSAPTTALAPADVRVYPNPFNNKVTVEFEATTTLGEVRLEVYDLFGKLVYQSQSDQVAGQQREEINLEEFSSGLFLLRMTENGQEVLRKKLIKN